jgi:hypothetical protein
MEEKTYREQNKFMNLHRHDGFIISFSTVLALINHPSVLIQDDR